MPLTLRPFAAADEDAAVAAHGAMTAERFTLLLGYHDQMPWVDWLADVERRRLGVDLAADEVRAAFLAADVDGQLVGRVSVRFTLNDWLAREGGHIGYGVLPAFRRQGYATAILRQAIDLAHQEGVAPLLLVCGEDNIGSATVIERCGGGAEGPAFAEDGSRIRRFWI